MKNRKILLLAILTYIGGFVFANADGDHGHGGHHDHDDHDDVKIKSPNGGRILKSVYPLIEFVLQEDNSIRLSFLNKKGEVVRPEQQVITLVSGSRSKPIQMKFNKSGNSLLSDGKLPFQNNLPIVLKIKTSPDSKNVYEKFMLNLNVCGGCNLKEYACTCDHNEGHDHGKDGGHDHGEHGHKH
jgi:hypothetical protein